MTTPSIAHQPNPKGASGRTFDLMVGGKRRGYLSYSLPDDGTMEVDFVQVDDALRGKGLGEQLIAAAADWARANGRQIVPLCSYARAVMTRTAKYRDVLA